MVQAGGPHVGLLSTNSGTVGNWQGLLSRTGAGLLEPCSLVLYKRLQVPGLPKRAIRTARRLLVVHFDDQAHRPVTRADREFLLQLEGA